MRISIGHRLFASVLLAILAVAATGIWLMRHKVIDSFADYAVNIELDRLDELAGSLRRQYAARGGWDFLPADNAAREAWIARELARLQQRRGAPAEQAPTRAQTKPAAGPPPPAMHAVTSAGRAAAAAPATPMPPMPPVPPTPPAPPLAPLPPPLVPAEPPAPPPPQTAIDSLGLQDRVTLLDAAGAYLAGRRPDSQPTARRSIVVDGQPAGYLLVAKAQRPSDAMASAFLQQLKDGLLIIVTASIALSALAASLLAAHFRKPIHRLADGARELAAGRFDTRLPVDRSDELGELAHSFNQLAQKLSMAEESRRQWVADTSHELRTPLSVLRAQLEAIQDGVRPASADTVTAMLRQVLALNKLIDELYALARADVGAPEYRRAPLDLWALVVEEAAAFEHKLVAAGLTLDIGAAPAAANVLADPDRMRQVITNLLENSVRYTAHGGKVALHARCDGPALLIEIDDSAPGVPHDALARLSERFFRVEASRSRAQGGAGLGLALCRRIVEAHGGQLAFAHAPLGGLRVTLSLALETA